MRKTEIDQNLLSILREGLSLHKGAGNAISSDKIIQRLEKSRGIKISGATLRAHIHHLRCYGELIICGDWRGYYLAAHEIEAKQEIKSMRSRSRKITSAADAMEKIYHRQFNQTTLFQ